MKSKPMFFTSDWHIGHKNVLAFSKRPFRDLDHMASVLVNNYNATVPADGVCYFLGDMGLCDKTTIQDVVSKLQGTKVLILGNHDKGMSAMYDRGFDVVLNGATIWLANRKITLAHCPLMGVYREDTTGMKGGEPGENWHGEMRRKSLPFTATDEGQYHLSGHIHSPNSGKSTKTLHRQYDVGVDANLYRPVSIKQIEGWICTTAARENYWRDIHGFPGYKVNRFGQIKSFRRYPEGKLLKPHKDKDGYMINRLQQNDKSKSLKVHRAVATAFLDNPEDLPQVNHKNGLKFDNNPDNLEWSSNLHNQRHAWDNDLKTVKLTVEQVMGIKERLSLGHPNTDIAVDYGVDQTTISNIKTGKIWQRVGISNE